MIHMFRLCKFSKEEFGRRRIMAGRFVLGPARLNTTTDYILQLISIACPDYNYNTHGTLKNIFIFNDSVGE